MTPTTFYPLKAPVRRKRKGAADASPAPGALTLVAAVYDGSLQTVTLTFSRAVDVSAFEPSQVNVIDGPNAWLLQATEILMSDDVTGTVSLTQVDTAEGEQVLLDATAANGIVAAGDGAAWDGVANLELPFP
jgi:hypothetical protein